MSDTPRNIPRAIDVPARLRVDRVLLAAATACIVIVMLCCAAAVGYVVLSYGTRYAAMLHGSP